MDPERPHNTTLRSLSVVKKLSAVYFQIFWTKKV